MANFASYFYFPGTANLLMTDNDASGNTLASGNRLAFIIRAAKAGNVNSFSFRLTTVTTGQQLTVSMQDLDGSGYPDGTPDQSTTVNVSNSDDDIWKTATFASPRTVTANDSYAVVIEYTSTAGTMGIAYGAGVLGQSDYVGYYTGGAWTRPSRMAMGVVGYSDGTYANGPDLRPHYPASIDFNDASTPDERGIKFQVTQSLIATGMHFFGRINPGSIVLYDAASSSIANSAILTTNWFGGAGGSAYWVAPFAAPATLSVGVDYRLTMLPSSASTMRIYSWSCPSAALKACMPGLDMVSATSRSNAGAWTDDTASQYSIGLVCSELVPSGGGGMLVNPGMTGGMK